MKGNAWLSEAMNPSATPFVPNVDKDGSPAGAKQEEQAETVGMSGSPVWRPKYQGRIRSFSGQKGFGFIDCQETLRAFKRDVFIHRFQMAESGLWVGQDVMFEVQLNKSGCPQARNVTPVTSMDDPNKWEDYSGGYDGWGASMGYGMQTPYPGGNSSSKGGNLGLGMPGYGGYDYMQGGDRSTRDLQKGSTAAMSAYGGIRNLGSLDGGDVRQAPEPIELMLRKCTGSADMWELIEQYGHSFGKKHVVAALYQLGLCREYERRTIHASLTNALLDRLVLFPAKDLTADEAAHVLWAFAILEEVRSHANAHRFAMELASEAVKRHHEFSPNLMASFVTSLTRLIRSPEEDDLVGKITTNFSDYALGSGALPRFPPEELRVWTNFLQEVSAPSHPGTTQYGALAMVRPTDGSGPFWGPPAPRPMHPGLPGQAKGGKSCAGGGLQGKPGYGPDMYSMGHGGRNPMGPSTGGMPMNSGSMGSMGLGGAGPGKGLSPNSTGGKGRYPQPGKGNNGTGPSPPQWNFDSSNTAGSKGPPGRYAGQCSGPGGKGKPSSKAAAAG